MAQARYQELISRSWYHAAAQSGPSTKAAVCGCMAASRAGSIARSARTGIAMRGFAANQSAWRAMKFQ